ncbi:FAD-binding oxidoreductase [Rhabdaerophilum sp. SD176]|uniref:NAD(P)/FAD-dependent oxidoreductase n=1 Tax=Rhabdaerophilum sp. SD176 TaxID=2983548 RepID=UPI0024E028D5|nr:FAD-binding oxidoreductase [Rhabdaerophilum sp. SD176]
MTDTADIVIAGGAVIGSSIAWHLATHPGFRGRILVVEPDPTYQFSASALSAGSIRQQFSQPVNIAISLYGIDFLRGIGERLAVEGERPEIGLHEGGYLYLGTEETRPVFEANNVDQTRLGARIALLDPAALAARFPYLSTEDITIGSLGLAGEGWFDGYGLMQAFRKAARAAGVEYRKARVVSLLRKGERIEGVTLDSGEAITCGAFVNAAGASGARFLCEQAGCPVPVYAKKRSVFSFAAKGEFPAHPLVIDTSGVWWRPEGTGFITGYSPDEPEPIDFAHDFEVDWPLFEDVIWPALATRIPAFEAIRPGRAWAGHYDMNLLDHNAVVGRLGDLANAYLACGFSGHGLQQSPAVGRGLAELIVEGAYRSLDLGDLGFARLTANRPLLERNVI